MLDGCPSCQKMLFILFPLAPNYCLLAASQRLAPRGSPDLMIAGPKLIQYATVRGVNAIGYIIVKLSRRIFGEIYGY